VSAYATKREVAILFIAAVVAGMGAARYGDVFFTKALERLRWIFWL
jgi:hypothetical protein